MVGCYVNGKLSIESVRVARRDVVVGAVTHRMMQLFVERRNVRVTVRVAHVAFAFAFSVWVEAGVVAEHRLKRKFHVIAVFIVFMFVKGNYKKILQNKLRVQN